MDRKAHWEGIYRLKGPSEVSWYQAEASISFAWISRLVPRLDDPIIDVGGGASVLVDQLVRVGYSNVTVLDVAQAALARARARLGRPADGVNWIEADALTAVLPARTFGFWHDRAVFHFLTDAADQGRYIAQMRAAVRPGGHVLVATFAEDGPTRCSGLDVMRYSAEGLHARFGPGFELVASEREAHQTPAGVEQAFTYCICRWAGLP